MSRLQLILVVVLCTMLAGIAAARLESAPPIMVHDTPIYHGRDADLSKAARDTIQLLGGPGRLDGAFEDASGLPDWQGWTHVDDSPDSQEDHWQISDLLAIDGDYSMWCGDWFGDDHGYGNGWKQNLLFVWPLPDATEPVTVAWAGLLDFDVEPGYDYVDLEAWNNSQWQTLTSWDGDRTVAIEELVSLDPADWTGEEGPAIALRIRFESDSAWSDEDGLYPTNGALRVDQLTVTIDDVLVDSEDFEDGISDHWVPTLEPGVGDFSHLWWSLEDVDPCASNYTPQVAFVDDGVVVPGTGGTACVTWCYGPGGYVVNNTGGLSGDSSAVLRNFVVSPVLEIPAGNEGVGADFSVYLHEELGSNSPTVFFYWEVRSSASDDPADLDLESWHSRNFLHYGGPVYKRFEEDVSSLMVPGARWFQIRLGVWDYFSWMWIWPLDGTPAPYIDDVSVRCWPLSGPALNAADAHLAQDTFPAIGSIDGADPAANSCRFDMATGLGQTTVAGDSLVVEVVAVRAGSTLEGPPQMHVVMNPNPVFDTVRQLPPGFSEADGLVRGAVDGIAIGIEHVRWSFDLPDTGFFYPGDEIRYFIEARDRVGDDVGVTRLPADTTGISRFIAADDGDLVYPEAFVVRALPSITTLDADYYSQPNVLLWFDQDSEVDLTVWRTAMLACGFDDDADLGLQSYDVYRTRSPSQGHGNGLGARATPAQLSRYHYILYDCGSMIRNTLAVGDANDDPSEDVQLLTSWLTGYDRHLWLCGDDLASDLNGSGAEGLAFLSDVIGASWVADDVRPYIMDQYAPTVRTVPGPYFPSVVDVWVDYGGCAPIRDFDAVEPINDAIQVAEFTDPMGQGGVFTYAAALLKQDAGQQTRVFYLPSAFAAVLSSPDWFPPEGYPFQAREALLFEWLPQGTTGVVEDVVPRRFAVSAYPNPFNPRVTIALDLPQPATASLRIYDVRGALVRTVRAEGLPAGRHDLVWQGENDGGAAMASGVYFYRVEAAGQTRQGKLTLVR